MTNGHEAPHPPSYVVACDLGLRFANSHVETLVEAEALLAAGGWSSVSGWHTVRGAGARGDEQVARMTRDGKTIELHLLELTAADHLRQHPMFVGLAATSATLYSTEPTLTADTSDLRHGWSAFSPTELARIESVIPPTATARPADSGTSVVVFRDHPLLEKLAVVRAVQPVVDMIWFVPKPDATKYRARTLDTMRALGVMVLPDLTCIEVARRLVEEIGERHLVVVDDGGALIAAVTAQAGLAERAVCIETTARGRNLLVEAGFRDQFLDLSTTVTKRSLSRAIAVSCLREFLHHAAHVRLSQSRAHLIGFGAIGRELALLLRAAGLDVTVADVAPERRRIAVRDGFEVFDSVEAALATHAHDFLVGCSGRQTVDLRLAARLANGAVAWAASSQDLSRLVAEARAAGISQTLPGMGTEVHIDGGPTITVLADGNAVNLFLAEGVSERDFHGFENEVVIKTLAAVRTTARTADDAVRMRR